jgi:positive regulator of sigma E activity
MRSTSRPRSMLRAAALVYFGPLVVIGSLALLVLGLGILAVAIQLLASTLKHAGV